ncbi:MAG TPA: hypothetical protein DCL54_13425 [Alphaproteobacteria bacterium]|nr:hypothetical protein [Alphaproteobacteria bacterium]HAJ47570.1 hypothetical protein [Alphaproteobacteria bacterium]
MRRKAFVSLLVSTALITVWSGGCASQALSGASDASTVVGLISTVATGKGLGDHLLSALTGEDCNLGEGLTREDRDVCEAEGAPATAQDFKGVFAEAKAAGGKAFVAAGVSDDAYGFNGQPVAVWAALKTAEAIQAAKTPTHAIAVATLRPQPKLEIKPDAGMSKVSGAPRKASPEAWTGSGGPLISVQSQIAAPSPAGVRTMEAGEPVVVLRLVPEAASYKREPLDEFAPPSADAAQSSPTAQAPGGSTTVRLDATPASPGLDAIPPDEADANGPPAPEDQAALGEATPDVLPPANVPSVRYPLARPAVKPTELSGVGGALNPEPPRAARRSSEPRPMRLNSNDRPRRERTRPARQRSIANQELEVPRVKTEVKDPLDLPAQSYSRSVPAAVGSDSGVDVTPLAPVGPSAEAKGGPATLVLQAP